MSSKGQKTTEGSLEFGGWVCGVGQCSGGRYGLKSCSSILWSFHIPFQVLPAHPRVCPLLETPDLVFFTSVALGLRYFPTFCPSCERLILCLSLSLGVRALSVLLCRSSNVIANSMVLFALWPRSPPSCRRTIDSCCCCCCFFI